MKFNTIKTKIAISLKIYHPFPPPPWESDYFHKNEEVGIRFFSHQDSFH